MSDTTTKTAEVKSVPLYSRVHAATLDTVTGEVVLTDGVNPKHLVQDLVREIQALQQQVQQLKNAADKNSEKL